MFVLLNGSRRSSRPRSQELVSVSSRLKPKTWSRSWSRLGLRSKGLVNIPVDRHLIIPGPRAEGDM